MGCFRLRDLVQRGACPLWRVRTRLIVAAERTSAAGYNCGGLYHGNVELSIVRNNSKHWGRTEEDGRTRKCSGEGRLVIA